MESHASGRSRGAGFRLWKCQNCGFKNPVNIRKKVIRATFLCDNCKEQVFVFDVKGESQYTKRDYASILQASH